MLVFYSYYDETRPNRGIKTMAADHSKNDADYQFHEDTYKGVCTLFQVSIVLIVITLLLMAWFVV